MQQKKQKRIWTDSRTGHGLLQSATLHNIDDYLRHKKSGGDTDLFENVDRMDGDVVYINIEAAVRAAGENNDNIDDEDFRIMDWKQEPG